MQAVDDKREIMEIIVNSLVEQFDIVEDESGKNFSSSRKIILRWARKHNLFPLDRDF